MATLFGVLPNQLCFVVLNGDGEEEKEAVKGRW